MAGNSPESPNSLYGNGKREFWQVSGLGPLRGDSALEAQEILLGKPNSGSAWSSAQTQTPAGSRPEVGGGAGVWQG